MPVLHGSFTLEGEIDYRIATHEISDTFQISFGINKIDIVLEFQQQMGDETASVKVARGLHSIHFLKIECMIERHDDKPDPFPACAEDFFLANNPRMLLCGRSVAFRGQKKISVMLTYTWDSTPGVPLPQYLSACGWGRDDTEIVAKELIAEGTIDFSDLKIDFRKNFCIVMPGELPYALTLSVVRHPEHFSRGQIQLKRTGTLENYGTLENCGMPIRRISGVMSIRGQASVQYHSFPPTPNEGDIYALTEHIALPMYGRCFFRLNLKMYIPVQATIAREMEDLEEDLEEDSEEDLGEEWYLSGECPAAPSTSMISS